MAQETVHVRKVLLVAPQMEARGTSEYSVNLARELKDSEVDVAVFCVPGPSLAALQTAKVPVQTFDRLDGLRFMFAHRRFLAAVEEFAPQLVHAQSYRAAAVLKLLSRRTDLPLVLTIHGVPGRRRAVRRMAGRLAGIIATTQNVREGLVNQCRVARQKVQVIHNGIDVEGLAEKGVPPIFQADAPVVGSVGPIEEHRGHDLFVQAASILVRGGVSAQFVVAGQGNYLPEIRELIARLGLERYVTLVTDFAAYEEVLGALDVVVQSSLVDVSGFSILESMGHGRPVIAFNTGTACEMVEDGRTGLLVPGGEVEALAGAIRQLITDKDMARRMGEAARRTVREQFSIRDVARMTMQFYAGILAEHASSP